MANVLVPVEERSLTPDEVAELDRRRRRGHLFLVMGFQCLLVSIFVLLWSGQDATYSPGWTHPNFTCLSSMPRFDVFCIGADPI